MDQKEIAGIIAREIVDRFKEENKNKKTKILILVNQHKGVKQFIENLFSFDESDKFEFHFSFVNDAKLHGINPALSENRINIINDKSQIKNIINDFNAIFITDITVSQLSSASNLIINDEITNTILMCIFNCLPLYIGSENFDFHATELPYPVRDAVNQSIRNLISYNIKFVQLENIEKILQKLLVKQTNKFSNKKIITRDDIVSGFNKGVRKITLYSGDIITSLARDEAKKNNIEIEEIVI